MRRLIEIGVLSLAVPPQVDLPLESSAAQLARERLETRVLSRMRDQVAALRERFAAYLTLVWLLACDRKQMETILKRRSLFRGGINGENNLKPDCDLRDLRKLRSNAQKIVCSIKKNFCVFVAI